MRTSLILFVVALATSAHVSAQDSENADKSYNFDLSQVYTGSGHGSSFAMNTAFQDGRRALQLGILYQEEQGRISGGEVAYKFFLGKNALTETSSASHGLIFKPYVHYNCIYHTSKVNTPDFVPTGAKKSAALESPSSPGTIATMEHYAGMGMQVMLSSNICFDSSLGFGAYIGSLDKINAPQTPGIHRDNYGFVMAVEFGLGYKFGL